MCYASLAMDSDDLCDFIANRMRMSHIYQPLLIKSLIESNGMATTRQLARSFLSQDESQLLHYEKRIREMPVRVLRRHGVVERDGEPVSLQVGRLSFSEKARIKALCDRRIQEFSGTARSGDMGLQPDGDRSLHEEKGEWT